MTKKIVTVVIIVVIAFFSWAAVGRIVRGLAMSIKEKESIEAARASGAGNRRIMLVEVLCGTAAMAGSAASSKSAATWPSPQLLLGTNQVLLISGDGASDARPATGRP